MSKQTKIAAATDAPKRGRPFVADEHRREGRIPIKVSTEERAALEAGAKAAGVKLGVWLRELGLEAAAAAVAASKRRRQPAKA